MKRFRTVLAFIPKYRKQILLGFGCLLVAGVLDMILPRLLKAAVELLKADEVDLGRVETLAAAILGIALVRMVFHCGMRWYLITTSRRVERDLRNRLYGHLLTLSPSFFDRQSTGDLMSRASVDVEQVRQAIGPGVMYIGNTIVRAPLAIIFMLHMSVPLTLLSLFPMVAIALITKTLAPRIQYRSRLVQEAAAALSTRAQESFAGSRVVKVFAREESEVEEFDREARGYLEASMGLAKIRAILRPSLQGLEGVASLILLLVGGRLISGGEMSIGALMAFFAYQRMLIWPMIAIGWVIALFQRGAAAMARIDEVLEVDPEVPAPTPPAAEGPVRGDIEYRDLTFAYDGEPVLEEINLRVPQGSSLAIVGPTGAGKSTLASLLLRMYPVPDGSVFVDGVDLNRYPLNLIRDATGFVPQETFLFSDTLRENIAYGVESAADEQIVAAAARSRLANEVAVLPKGYDTMLGERGVNLSGGQKQRTALARAILRNPPILVLDDALSAVDTQTEEEILRELKEVMSGRTTILIGHRISTVKGADQIVVLEEGRIAERGTHEELIALGGRYAEMDRLQKLEEELEALE